MPRLIRIRPDGTDGKPREGPLVMRFGNRRCGAKEGLQPATQSTLPSRRGHAGTFVSLAGNSEACPA